MQKDRGNEQLGEHPMQTGRERCEAFGFGHQGQVLAKGPEDWRKACGGGVVDPARQGNHEHREIEHPVDCRREGGFGAPFRVQGGWSDLGECPQDAQGCHKKRGDADGFVQREELRLLRKCCRGIIGHVIGNDAQRDGCKDEERGQPMQAARESAKALGGVVKGHDGVRFIMGCGSISP